MRAFRRAVFMIVAACVLLVGSSTPALAAESSSFTVSVTPLASEVTVGNTAEFEIGYSCTGQDPCSGVKVDLPTPLGYPDALFPIGSIPQIWQDPVVTSSADVSRVDIDKANVGVSFTFASQVAPGTSGTLRVKYMTQNIYTPNNTPFTVTAIATGTNVPESQAQASVVQKASPPPGWVDQLWQFQQPYLDRELAFSIDLSAGVYTYNPGYEGMKDVSATLTLPAGAKFASATPEPASVSSDGLTIRWDNIQGDGTNSPLLWREDIVYRVTYPSSAFVDQQQVTPKLRMEGTSLSGASFVKDSVDSRVRFRVKKFVDIFDIWSNATLAGGLDISNAYSLGPDGGSILPSGTRRGVNFDVSNLSRSTVPATSYEGSFVIPFGYSVSALAVTAAEPDMLLRWTTKSGATGEFLARDFGAALGDLKDPAHPSLTALGLPDGEPLAKVEFSGGTLQPGQGPKFQLDGVFEGPNETRVDLEIKATMNADNFPVRQTSRKKIEFIVDPLQLPSLSMGASAPGQSSNPSLTFRPGDPIQWSGWINNGVTASQPHKDLQPVLYVAVPKGAELTDEPFAIDPQYVGRPWMTDDFYKYTTSVTHNAALDRDILTVRWPDSVRIDSMDTREFISFDVNTVVTSAPPGELKMLSYLGDSRGQIPEFPFTMRSGGFLDASVAGTATLQSSGNNVRDDLDLDGDGISGGSVERSVATAQIGAGAALRSQLSVRGSLDTDFVSAPVAGSTVLGNDVAYRLPVENSGNVPLRDTVIYDVLPYVGDTGVSAAGAGLSRGSQFMPTLAAAVEPPAGFTVQYSMSTNPCRPEVFPLQLSCDSDWTDAPTNFGQVRALKFTQIDGTVLAPGSVAEATWVMKVAADVPLGTRAVNSAAYSSVRTDTGNVISAEPAAVAFEVVQADLAVAILGSTLVRGTPKPLSVTVTNNGPSASAAHVELNVPEELVVAESAPLNLFAAGSWTCAITASLVACDSSDVLQPGDSQALPLTIEAAQDLVGRSAVVNAAISGRFPDPVTLNNTSQATFFARAGAVEPRLSIVKTDDTPVAFPGEEKTYKLTVVNLSATQAVTGVDVQDVLPAELEFVSANESGTHDAASRTVTWELGTLGAGETKTVELRANVVGDLAAGAAVVNTARVTTDDGCLDDKTCVTTDTDHAIDLSVTNDDGRDLVKSGERFSYDVVAENRGEIAASGVLLVEALPKNFEFVSATRSGTYNAELHRVEWQLNSLESGAKQTVALTVKASAAAKAGEKLEHTATLSAQNGCMGACVATDVDYLDKVVPKPGPTPTPGPTPGPTPDPEQKQDNNGLATTGGVALSALGVAAAVLVGGGAVLMAARRRRSL